MLNLLGLEIFDHIFRFTDADQAFVVVGVQKATAPLWDKARSKREIAAMDQWLRQEARHGTINGQTEYWDSDEGEVAPIHPLYQYGGMLYGGLPKIQESYEWSIDSDGH